MKLWKNPRDGYWHIRHGQRRKALHTKDETTANRIYREFETLSLEERLAELEGLSRVTLSEFRDRYVAARGDRAKDTLRADRLAFNKAIAFFEDKLLATIGKEDIGRFVTALRESGLKHNSVSAYCRHLRAAFNEAIEWGIIKKNPFRKVRMGRASLPAPRLVVGPIRRKLLAAAGQLAREDLRFKGFRKLIEFGLATGLRRIEISRLKWADVRENSVIVHGKGDKYRDVEILPTTRALLGKAGKPGTYVFPWRDPNKITRMFKAVATEAGIPDVTPHTLRHTTESQLAMVGVDLKGRMQMLGHSTPEMALHYTQITAEQLRKALGQIEREGKRGRKAKAG